MTQPLRFLPVPGNRHRPAPLSSLLTLLSLLLSLVPGNIRAADVAVPEANPWGAAGPYPMSHDNPAQTDDGAQLVAFWREAIPEDFTQKPGTQSRRIANQVRIRVSPTTVEASPAVYGSGVAVLNSTYPDSAPAPLHIIGNAFLAGETREPPLGRQKFDWNSAENRFEESWFLGDIDNTDWMPPAISPQNGLAYVATKVDGVYEYRAIDWETGKVVARWPFPDQSVLWNNWGGITTLLEDGDLLLGGFFAVKRYDVGHLR